MHHAVCHQLCSETVDDVLADPSINQSLKEEISKTISLLSTLKHFASLLLNRNKTPTNANDVETDLNATVNGINN